VGHDLLIIKGSRSHSDTPHAVGLLWTNEQPDVKRPQPDNTQYSQETYLNTPAGFEPTFPESERPQTHALYRAATGIPDLVMTVI